MSAQLVQFLLTGLTVGAIYALVALGFAIIYNASHVINFAQGEFVMIGGMAAATFVEAGLPLPLAALYHRELTLTATYSSSPAELEEAFALLAVGRIRVDGLISHRLPLGRLGEGVELMRRHEAVKVYVIP